MNVEANSRIASGKLGRLCLAIGVVLIASLACGKSGVPPTANRSHLVQEVDGIVSEYMEKNQVVGVSIGIAKDGEVLLAKGYGYADIENDVRATEHTVYRIGSITKQFTAVATMLLVEDGKLSLDERLETYLPDYPTAGRVITLDRLLNHTSGIKSFTEIPGVWENNHLDTTQEQMIDLFSNHPFQFEPGERFQYNNSGYYLLGIIMEKASGKSYEDFVKERVLDPLGLDETYYLYRAPIVRNRAQGYDVENGQWVNDKPINMKRAFSAGALGSTVTDLLRWQIALHGDGILSEQSYRHLTTPRTLTAGTAITYGFGLFIGDMDGHRKIDHAGGINGFLTELSYYPEDGLAVSVLTNTTAGNPKALESRIARAVLGIPELVYEAVDLSLAQLDGYVGTYAGEGTYEVELKEGHLYALWGERLIPLGEHVFISEVDPDRKYTFEMEEGRAVLFRWERQGQADTAGRVDDADEPQD